MNRPKSASSTSFLDDLLGNEIENAVSGSNVSTSTISSSAQRQRKSVRFFDDGADSESNVRPHSSTLDSLLGASNEKGPETSAKSKVNWLGISSSEDETPRATQEGSSLRPSTAFSGISAPRERAQNSSSGSDWLRAGLRARQAVTQPKEIPKPISNNQQESVDATKSELSSLDESRSWQPKILDQAGETGNLPIAPSRQLSTNPITSPIAVASQQSPTQSITQPIATKLQPTHPESSISIDQRSGKVSELHELSGIDSNFSLGNVDRTSVAYLQTQLRIVTLEKTFLEQTVDQMKSNHQDELNAMISLYEQQMRLTSEMYKRHEGMIQEEHDQRVSEFKTHLQQLETEITKMRVKYQDRLANLESEWKNDLAKTKESHSQNVDQLNQEHNQEIQRLEQRLKFDTDNTIQSSNDILIRQSKTIGEMLAKWEESAHRIELLQKSVITRQEELVKERRQNEEEQQFSDKDIETQWKHFIEELQKQREDFEKVMDQEREKIEAKTAKHIEEDRLSLETERQMLHKMKTGFAQEVNEWRERETRDSLKAQKERDKLREEVLSFEQRRSLIETLYKERNEMLEQERTRLTAQTDEIREKQKEIDKQQSELMKTLFTIRESEEELELKREQFKQEKDQLKQLGDILFHRAEELERLGEMTLKEKIEGIQTMDEIDAFRSEINSKMEIIEESTKQLRLEENKLAIKNAQLEQHWLVIKELKESIICNLCGTTISQAKFWTTKFAIKTCEKEHNGTSVFHSLMNTFRKGETQNNPSNLISRDTSSDEMNDHSLLLWQVAGQKDAASLAEETKFLKLLREKAKQTSKKEFPIRINAARLK